MHTIITSDIHLGSQYCQVESFLQFLDNLPDGVDFVMNGDVVDHWHRDLKGNHLKALQRIREESLYRRVIWVRGNHDDKYNVPEPADIEFMTSYNIGHRLHISHGYDFDTVMPYHKTFIKLFRFFHHMRILLGAEPVHVAQYAKRFSLLYGVLRKHVSMNAVEYAREEKFEATTCGHTHYVEDRVIDGIRYINTGSWTEPPVFYLDVTDDEIKLVEVTSPVSPACQGPGMEAAP